MSADSKQCLEPLSLQQNSHVWSVRIIACSDRSQSFSPAYSVPLPPLTSAAKLSSRACGEISDQPLFTCKPGCICPWCQVFHLNKILHYPSLGAMCPFCLGASRALSTGSVESRGRPLVLEAMPTSLTLRRPWQRGSRFANSRRRRQGRVWGAFLFGGVCDSGGCPCCVESLLGQVANVSICVACLGWFA